MKKISAGTAAELCDKFQISSAARDLLEEGMSPGAFLDRLEAAGLHRDAVAFLARALPKREAVWWACTCARENVLADTPAVAIQALESAEAWVYKPNEERRREAGDAAARAGNEAAETWAARAAFWSGGSVTPPDQPAVAPGEDLTAGAAAGCIMLVAVRQAPEKADEHYRLFLAKGKNIADGGTGRDSPASST